MVKSYFGINEPDVVEIDADAGMADADPEPFSLNGSLYLPAWCLDVGRELAGDEVVVVSMRQDDAGLFVNLSPDGAREFAAAVVRAADRVAAERTETEACR